MKYIMNLRFSHIIIKLTKLINFFLKLIIIIYI